MNAQAGQPEVLKRQNRQYIMSLIEREPYVTRAELARLSGLSRTTISNLIKEFIESGLIEERGDLTSTGGRPGTRLEVSPSRWFSLGAEYRDREWIFVLLDLQARVVQTLELPTESNDPRTAVLRLSDGLQQMRKKCPGSLLPAVGIGVPGLVDKHTGIIKQAEDLGWRDVPIAERIIAELQLPAYVLNRHRAAGLAEARYGAGAGVRELVYIGIGTGISSALFIQGVPVDGASSSFGELGHVTVDPNGPPCSCGNNGCLQSYASGNALVKEAKRLLQEGGTSSLGQTPESLAALSGEAICEAAKAGDELALACVRHAARYLGIVIANQINYLNPDTVVLGGPIGQCAEPLLDLIRTEVKSRALAYPLSAVRILSSTLGRNAGAIGAARLVLDQKLSLIFE